MLRCFFTSSGHKTVVQYMWDKAKILCSSNVLHVRIQKQDLVDSVSIQSGTSLRNRAASCTEHPLT